MSATKITVLAAAAAACGLAALAPVSAKAYWVAPAVVVAPPPVVYVPPPRPVYVAPPRVVYVPYPRAHWVRPHYDWRGVFIPGHWA